ATHLYEYRREYLSLSYCKAKRRFLKKAPVFPSRTQCAAVSTISDETNWPEHCQKRPGASPGLLKNSLPAHFSGVEFGSPEYLATPPGMFFASLDPPGAGSAFRGLAGPLKSLGSTLGSGNGVASRIRPRVKPPDLASPGSGLAELMASGD